MRPLTLTFHDIGPQKGSKFDTWTINNKSWPDMDPIHVTGREALPDAV